jgi:hypothetical protein
VAEPPDGKWSARFHRQTRRMSSDGRSILTAIGEGDADVVILDG